MLTAPWAQDSCPGSLWEGRADIRTFGGTAPSGSMAAGSEHCCTRVTPKSPARPGRPCPRAIYVNVLPVCPCCSLSGLQPRSSNCVVVALGQPITVG